MQVDPVREAPQQSGSLNQAIVPRDLADVVQLHQDQLLDSLHVLSQPLSLLLLNNCLVVVHLLGQHFQHRIDVVSVLVLGEALGQVPE